MPIPTYTPGYPPDGSSLGQTKSTIRNNLDGTFDTLAVDHVNNNGQPGSQPAGYHTVIHSVPQGNNPAAIAGYGQLFSKTINSFTNDQALFWETGGGLIQQLTVNLTPSAATNGYTFLPGGIILQWGVVNNPGSSGTVQFATNNIDFPNNFFSVQTCLRYDGPHSAAAVFVNGAPTKSQFAYTITVSGTTALYWFAIGN
jgi:hypothetical protein